MEYTLVVTNEQGITIHKGKIESKTLAGAKMSATKQKKMGFGSTVQITPKEGLPWKKTFLPGEEWTYA